MEGYIKARNYAILIYAKEDMEKYHGDDLAVIMERDSGNGEYSIKTM